MQASVAVDADAREVAGDHDADAFAGGGEAPFGGRDIWTATQ